MRKKICILLIATFLEDRRIIRKGGGVYRGKFFHTYAYNLWTGRFVKNSSQHMNLYEKQQTGVIERFTTSVEFPETHDFFLKYQYGIITRDQQTSCVEYPPPPSPISHKNTCNIWFMRRSSKKVATRSMHIFFLIFSPLVWKLLCTLKCCKY